MGEISLSTGMSLGEPTTDSPPAEFIQTTDAVVANTTTEATLFAAGVGSLTIASDDLKVGNKFIIRLQGIVSDTGNPTVQLQIKLGSVVIGDTGGNTLGNVTNDHWILEVEFVVRTEGVTGTIMSSGGFFTEQGDHFGLINIAALTIDTTTSQTIDATIIWGAANVSNTITCQIAQVEMVNV